MSTTKKGLLSDDWPEPSQFKKSIRLEFTLYVSAIILVLMLATGYVISRQYVRTVTRDVVDKVLVQARSYSGPAGKMIISDEEPDVLSLNNMCRRIAGDNPDVYWAGITGDDGIFLAHTDIRQVVASARMGPITASQFHGMLRAGEGFVLDGDTVFTSVPVEESNVTLGRLVVAASAKPISRARRSSILTVVSITSVMILVGIPATVYILRRKLRPIGIITDHLKAADFERFALAIPLRSDNEFGFLAETIRVMGAKLGKAHEELLEKERMTRELEIAREIQASILPKQYPRGTKYELAGTYRSALEVGGDYYDFIDFGDDSLGILIADVSGKSLPGMLVMLITRDIVRRLARSVDEPAYLLSRVNAELLGNIRKNMFVTMFLGILNTETGRFRFASAGHNPLIVVRGSESQAELIKTRGFPLGLVGSDQYGKRVENGQIELKAGDWLVLYTDGVSEAQNAGGEEFGMARFLDLIGSHRLLSAEDFTGEVIEGHAAFVGAAPQFDDMTLIAVKWLGLAADNNLRGLVEGTNVG
jgi:serine phosphatase RsbU (regulator of sigma subunit)